MKRAKMNTRANVITCLRMSVFLLVTGGRALAQPLMPLYESQVHTYRMHNAVDSVGWSMLQEVMGPKVTLGSQDYFHLQTWNSANDSQFRDYGYARSTEQAVYRYNPAGEEFAVFQKAPVGTKWSVPLQQGTYPYTVIEIVAIETVTVPYGTFDQAYKSRLYGCYDPDNLSLGKSPDWYNWIVPGIGWVRTESYRDEYPPVIIELTGLAVAPVYRFWSPIHSRHFYTVRKLEQLKLLIIYPLFWTYEGIAYYTLAEVGEPTTRPIYRFWSNALNAHFYTISESEKTKLINNYPDVWTYEGPVFYAFPEGSQPSGPSPVYRFWSDILGCHFYTMSQTERDKLINNYPDVWAYEGIAWYAHE